MTIEFGYRKINECRSMDEDISRGDKVGWWQSGLRISSFWPSEEQNVRLRAMKLIVNPSSGLLDTKRSPFLNEKRNTF